MGTDEERVLFERFKRLHPGVNISAVVPGEGVLVERYNRFIRRQERVLVGDGYCQFLLNMTNQEFDEYDKKESLAWLKEVARVLRAEVK